MPSIGLTAEELAEVFPFHVVFDRDGTVIQAGAALQKALPGISLGSGIDRHFAIRRPRMPLTYETVRRHHDALFFLESKSAPLVLKGQMLPVEAAILFLAAPWVTDIRDVESLGVSLQDFAIHDPVADYLVLLQSKTTALADSERLSQSLKEMKNRLQSIIGSMDDSLVVLNTQGYIETVNAATCELLGYAEPEISGRHVGVLFAAEEAEVENDGRQGARRQGVFPELVGRDTLRNLDAAYTTKDGQCVPVLLTVSALREEGKLVGTVCVARDARERLQAEADAARAATEKFRAEELANAYADLSRAHERLKKAQEQLVQAGKMLAIGQLAAGLAHEINNPLGVILGFAQGLERRVDEESPFRRPVASIVREAMRCKDLIERLLTFSHRASSVKEEIDLNAVIRSANVLLTPRAKMQKVQIVEDLGPDLPNLPGNKAQIEQVILDLGNNAMDAMMAGGTLTIRASSAGADDVLVEVLDTGCGMQEGVRSRIFEPFFTTKEVGEGTGLGLSLAYEVVRQHGGSITVESTQGEGTNVAVRLSCRVGVGVAAGGDGGP